MSIAYANIARAVALRASLFIGGDAVSKNTAYTGAFSDALLDATEVPYGALRADILAVEKQIAGMIARQTNSPYRTALSGESSNVANNGAVPTQTSGGVEFIGVFDAIIDGSDGTPLLEMPVQWVVRRNANSGNFWKLPNYYYAIDGSRIVHTRTNVKFRGCAWSYATQLAAFPAGNSPLPQEFESLWICKVLAQLPQEDWFIQEAQIYQNLAMAGEAMIVNGHIRDLQLPQTPTNTASANPVKD